MGSEKKVKRKRVSDGDKPVTEWDLDEALTYFDAVHVAVVPWRGRVFKIPYALLGDDDGGDIVDTSEMDGIDDIDQKKLKHSKQYQEEVRRKVNTKLAKAYIKQRPVRAWAMISKATKIIQADDQYADLRKYCWTESLWSRAPKDLKPVIIQHILEGELDF